MTTSSSALKVKQVIWKKKTLISYKVCRTIHGTSSKRIRVFTIYLVHFSHMRMINVIVVILRLVLHYKEEVLCKSYREKSKSGEDYSYVKF